VSVEIDEVGDSASALPGVRHTSSDGLAQWRYHGRLVARQLGISSLAIRADLANGDRGTIEDALGAACRLQRDAD
jgi:hypothetical protein